ncbi:response regulator [Alginatibacterium sediminis]|uniref:Response regulator n=1 Tax=Alginatibacterium sediminis TaxID=2164068 RepID=A0A420ELB2_9ALTE|nr:response regulator [Alginatibacterium sediminis]RKF21420.1 response regulator [Alginatibacterium sediminis]
MSQLFVVCIDDERAVLDSVIHDLQALNEAFIVEACESVAEAKEVIADNLADGNKLALVLADHIMPDELGVEYLITLNHEEQTIKSKKILLTGQAGLQETIEAINRGGLSYYLAKPWKPEQLQKVVIEKLTDYVIENDENPLQYAQHLDSKRIFEAVAQNRLNFD